MSILYNESIIDEPIDVKGGVDERGMVSIAATWLRTTLAEALQYPPSTWQGLTRRTIVVNRNKGGGYMAIGNYAGVSEELAGPGSQDAEEAGRATYELDTTQMSKPILVHPRIKELKKLYGWVNLPDDGGWGFPEQMPSAPSARSNGRGGESRDGVSPLYGVDEWLDIGAVWRKRWVSTEASIPSDALRNLGRIEAPEGPVPQATDGRNWLRAGIRAAGFPGAWDITVEWQLSGRGGWEPSLYRGQK